MSDFCRCCPTNEEYVQGHLNWNVEDAHGHGAVSEFMKDDWFREARECKACWKSNGEPVRMSDSEPAEILERLYGVMV